MLVTPNNVDPVAKIKVVGVGGGGNNTLNTMISDYNIEGVEFYAFNTDAQALKQSLAPITLQMGSELTRGLGVGGDHSLGAQAAEESLDEIHEHLTGADMVFITAGMGGGTGTGAAPVVAGVAKNLGALTVAVVTTPFKFEGRHREEISLEGLAELKDKVDTLIVVPNQRLIDIIDDNISFLEAMKEVDKVLAEGVKSISGLVTTSGFINVDFSDVKSIMTDAGSSLMGMGRATGDNRAESAARQATNSPLLDMSIEGATGVLFNVVGSENMSMSEINTAAQLIEEAVDPNAQIIFGATVDPELKDELIITIVATGFDESKQVHTPASKTPVTLVQDNSTSTPVADRYVDDTPSHTTTTSFVDEPSSKTHNSTNSAQDDDELEVPAFMRRR
jgi:cell division protein FtsZ